MNWSSSQYFHWDKLLYVIKNVQTESEDNTNTYNFIWLKAWDPFVGLSFMLHFWSQDIKNLYTLLAEVTGLLLFLSKKG